MLCTLAIQAQQEYPIITRLEGVGAGQNFLELADEEYDEILEEDFNYGEVTYKPGAAPINVKVVDSSALKTGNYIITFADPFPGDTLSLNTRWILMKENVDTIAVADQTIAQLNEQIIPELGISVLIGQSDDAGDQADFSNGTIGYSLTYGDTSKPEWLRFIWDDIVGVPYLNFIQTELPSYQNFWLDSNQVYSTFSPWVPFILTDYTIDEPIENPLGWSISPGWMDPSGGLVQSPQFGGNLQHLNNVDIILTSDTSKWSRSVVVETSNVYYTTDIQGVGLPSEGNKKSLQPRSALSVGKYDADNDGFPDPDGALDASGNPLTGMGWFPGYAVDVETGERLNIFFGENSVYTDPIADALQVGDIAHDMIWNPGKQVLLLTSGFITPLEFFAGGQQYVYVSRTKYDGCTRFRQDLDRTGLVKARALASLTWCAIPLTVDDPTIDLLPLNDGLIPNDVIVKLRVDNPYQLELGNGLYDEYPTYRFRLEGVTAVEEPGSNESSFILYPNPTRNTIIIETKIAQPGKETISIYDTKGQLMLYNTFRDQTKIEINVSGLEPGIYMIEFQLDARRETKKMMIY